MKRALAIAAALAFLTLLVAAFLAAVPRGNPGPYLSPSPMNDASAARVRAQLELAEGGGNRQHIVFGRREFGSGPADFAAAIVVVRESGRVEVPLPADTFDGHEWVHVARSGDGLEIWALADNAVESPGWELPLVASNDGGLTWRHLSNVPKPYYFATFVSFRMSKSGKGAVSVSLADAAPAHRGGDGRILGWLRSLNPPDEGERGEEQPAGLYVYRTDDGGLTWSGPEYFEDDTEDAWRTTQAPPGFLDP